MRVQPVVALFLIAGALLAATGVSAQTPTPIPPRDSTAESRTSSDDLAFVVPAPNGFVNDFAERLSPEDEAALERIVLEVRDKSRGEIAVVTLPTLAGYTPQEVAMYIGNTWGVGYAGSREDPRTNTGVVVLVAPTERHVRIELGTGAQAFITDAEATRISQLMTPCFAKGDFARGLRVGVSTLAAAFARQFHFDLTPLRDPVVAC